MDIDKILHTKIKVNNDREKLTAYNLSRGPSYSLNENLVPEQLFDNPDTTEKEADGISATKALSLAAQQGQTIYTVTKANYAEVLPKLNHSDVVMTDIRNGVNAGKTVTVHDTQITLNGWSGTGYTILDPESGAGAYMIGGGLDGGFTETDLANILSSVSLSVSDIYNKSSDFSRYYSWRLARDNFLRNIGKWLGVLGFGISTFTTVKDDSLSVNSKIGRILTTFVGGVIISGVTGILATGFLAVLAIAFVTVAVSYAIYRLNNAFFSARTLRRKNQENFYA